MANPRKFVDFTDLNEAVWTFLADGSTITYDLTQPGGSQFVGRAVTLSADGTVALAADGNAVVGRLEGVEADGVAAVRREGALKLPKGDGTVTRGTKVVGNIRTGAAGSTSGFVRSVNTAVAAEGGVARGCILDVSDVDNIVVDFN